MYFCIILYDFFRIRSDLFNYIIIRFFINFNLKLKLLCIVKKISIIEGILRNDKVNKY